MFGCSLTVESYDRSTTREYGDLRNDMSHKYETLKASEEEAVKLSDEHYKSILRQVRIMFVIVMKRGHSKRNRSRGGMSLLYPYFMGYGITVRSGVEGWKLLLNLSSDSFSTCSEIKSSQVVVLFILFTIPQTYTL